MVKMKAVLVRSDALHVTGGAGQGEDSCVTFTGDDGVDRNDDGVGGGDQGGS